MNRFLQQPIGTRREPGARTNAIKLNEKPLTPRQVFETTAHVLCLEDSERIIGWDQGNPGRKRDPM